MQVHPDDADAPRARRRRPRPGQLERRRARRPGRDHRRDHARRGLDPARLGPRRARRPPGRRRRARRRELEPARAGRGRRALGQRGAQRDPGRGRRRRPRRPRRAGRPTAVAQLEFDEETSKRIEAAYAGRDMVRRRELVREALAVRPGRPGARRRLRPGLLRRRAARARSGPDGAVVGVDSSESMLGARRARAAASATTSSSSAATRPSLPVADALVRRRAQRPGARVRARDRHRARRDPPRAAARRPGGDLGRRLDNAVDADRRARADAADARRLGRAPHPRRAAADADRAAARGGLRRGARWTAYAFATNELGPDTYGGFLVPFMEQFAHRPRGGRRGRGATPGATSSASSRRAASSTPPSTQFRFTATRRRERR